MNTQLVADRKSETVVPSGPQPVTLRDARITCTNRTAKREPWKLQCGGINPGFTETMTVEFDIDGRAAKVRITKEAAPGWHTTLREVWCGDIYARDFSGEDTYDHDHPYYPSLAWLVSLARHIRADEAIIHTAVLLIRGEETIHAQT